MSLETRADLNAYADAEFTTNGVGAISGADLNQFAKDISDSAALKSEAAEVSLAMLENRAQGTLLGRAAGAGTGAPQELTPTQAKALLAIAAADVSGLSAFATSTDLANATGTLAIARIADGTVTLAKLENRAQATFIGRQAGAGTGVPQELSRANALAILALTYADFETIAGLSVVGRAANTTGVAAAITAANDGEVLRRSGTAIGFGTIATAGITDAAVTLAKMANLAQSTIIGRAAGAGTGVPTALTATQVKTLLAIAAADVSGLAAIATSGSASDLITGTVADARISGAYTGFTTVSLTTSATFTGNSGGFIGVAAAGLNIRTGTADAADTSAVQISGGGGVASALRGGGIQLYGNEHATFPGQVRITPGTGQFTNFVGGDVFISTGNLQILNGGILVDVGNIDAFGNITGTDLTAGGAILGNTVSSLAAMDAGGNLSTAGILFYSGAGTNWDFRHVTSDGSDNRAIRIGAGGAIGTARGAIIQLFGNEHASTPGEVHILRGTTGHVRIDGQIINTGNFGGFLFGSKTFDFPSVLNNGSTTTTVTVTGAAVGDLALPVHGTWATGWIIMARVTSANTVTVYMTNNTGGTSDLASGTLSVMVFQVPP